MPRTARDRRHRRRQHGRVPRDPRATCGGRPSDAARRRAPRRRGRAERRHPRRPPPAHRADRPGRRDRGRLDRAAHGRAWRPVRRRRPGPLRPRAGGAAVVSRDGARSPAAIYAARPVDRPRVHGQQHLQTVGARAGRALRRDARLRLRQRHELPVERRRAIGSRSAATRGRPTTGARASSRTSGSSTGSATGGSISSPSTGTAPAETMSRAGR